jgi:hypothetical protein
MVKGYFSSHSVVTSTQSNFSKVGVERLFAHVYFLPDITSSLKFKPSIMALKRNGHRLLYRSFFLRDVSKCCNLHLSQVEESHGSTNLLILLETFLCVLLELGHT